MSSEGARRPVWALSDGASVTGLSTVTNPAMLTLLASHAPATHPRSYKLCAARRATPSVGIDWPGLTPDEAMLEVCRELRRLGVNPNAPSGLVVMEGRGSGFVKVRAYARPPRPEAQTPVQELSAAQALERLKRKLTTLPYTQYEEIEMGAERLMERLTALPQSAGREAVLQAMGFRQTTLFQRHWDSP